MSEAVRLIVGLGNPGKNYEQTRHNAGFWFVDEVAHEYGVNFRKENKFYGEVCRFNAGERECWLLKPATYMNKSGQAVAAIAAYYKISPESILVVHDEIDHDAGSVRLKRGGGHAGHNGLRDIISAIGSKDFLRLRLGVGHPGSKKQVVNYVLGLPSREDAEKIHDSIKDGMKVIGLLLSAQEQIAMNQLHSA